MLLATDISKAYSDRTLFSGLTLNVSAGDRIALVGANGSGKTTLLDILAGETAPESGNIIRQRNSTIGYLKQEAASFTGKTLLQEVLDAGIEANALASEIAETRELLAQESGLDEQEELLLRLARLDADLEAAGGDDREYQAKAILTGLGFRQTDFLRPIGEFSGGWVMRAGLARILFRNPDLLLLDEPTNHLDLEANLWFENYLAAFHGGVLITSHDRAFLNQVATRVLAIEQDGAELHKGNYDDYLVARERSSGNQARHCGQARTGDSAADAFCRPVPVQGDQGHPGAKPVKAVGEDSTHRTAAGHKKSTLLLPGAAPQRFRGHFPDQYHQAVR